MLNYLKKFSLDILPSVAATVIGAYIVNHYVSKPATDAPVAAVTAPADAKKAKDGADLAGIPQPGVKAKGISERAMIEKSAAEQPNEFKPAETKSAETKPAIDSKPAETASVTPEPKQHRSILSSLREKATGKPAAPTPAAAAPAETASATPADGRDANDLARAAIERLRGSDGQPRVQEASRSSEVPRVDAPKTVTSTPAMASVRPLPPPINVTTPPVETASAPYTASIDPNRPTPPADIPPPPPLDIRADASKLASRTNSMAQDVLHAAKSMFSNVLPNSDKQQNSSSASQFTD